jgi:hypothetical protein
VFNILNYKWGKYPEVSVSRSKNLSGVEGFAEIDKKEIVDEIVSKRLKKMLIGL